MTEQQFNEACSKLSIKIFKLTEDLKAELARDGADQNDLVKRFVASAYNLAYEIPELKTYLDTNQPKDINNLRKYSDVLQPLLLAGGYYFQGETTGEFNEQTGVISQISHLSMAKIIDKKTLVFEDGKGTKKVPLYILGEPSFTNTKDPALARYNSNTNVAVAFQDRLKLSFYKKIRELTKLGYDLKGIDIPQLFQESIRETLIHEATHGYLTDRHPRSGETKMRNMYKHTLLMPLANGKQAGLARIMHPVQMQELCAAGNEIYNSNAKYPFTLMSYLKVNAGNNPVHGYRLLAKALPLIVLKHAKGTEKDSVMQAISNGEHVNTDRFIQLVLKMDDKQKQLIGREMYELGLHLIKTLEADQMTPFEIPLSKTGQ